MGRYERKMDLHNYEKLYTQWYNFEAKKHPHATEMQNELMKEVRLDEINKVKESLKPWTLRDTKYGRSFKFDPNDVSFSFDGNGALSGLPTYDQQTYLKERNRPLLGEGWILESESRSFSGSSVPLTGDNAVHGARAISLHDIFYKRALIARRKKAYVGQN